jgi:hypothetical protein
MEKWFRFWVTIEWFFIKVMTYEEEDPMDEIR